MENPPKKISDNVWMLGILDQPYYLVKGNDGMAVVEGGVSTVAPLVVRQLAGLNMPSPLTHLIITHTHTDHMTGLIRLKKEMPELILTGSKDTDWVLSNKKILGRLQEGDKMYADMFLSQGLTEALQNPLKETSFPLDKIIEDNDTLSLGGVSLNFIDAPGHAPGNICIKVMPDNLVFISDTAGYATNQKKVYPLFFQNFNLYVESIKKIKAMEPSAIALGHHLVINDKKQAEAFLAMAVKAAMEMKGEMCAGKTKNDEMAHDFAKRLAGFGFFKYFPADTLKSYAELLIRRAAEAD